jgi:hypothetical protein
MTLLTQGDMLVINKLAQGRYHVTCGRGYVTPLKRCISMVAYVVTNNNPLSWTGPVGDSDRTSPDRPVVLLAAGQQAPLSFQMFHAIGDPGVTPVDQYSDVHLWPPNVTTSLGT